MGEKPEISHEVLKATIERELAQESEPDRLRAPLALQHTPQPAVGRYSPLWAPRGWCAVCPEHFHPGHFSVLFRQLVILREDPENSFWVKGSLVYVACYESSVCTHWVQGFPPAHASSPLERLSLLRTVTSAPTPGNEFSLKIRVYSLL